MSLSLTGETAGFGKESASESLIRALLARIVTSESIFLTKIQGKSLRQLTLARSTPALETKQIFDELCDYGGSGDTINKQIFNRFLQVNGFCFPAHLVEAFFRRFNFEKENQLSYE